MVSEKTVLKPGTASWRTFWTFLESLKGAPLPTQVDNDVLSKFSGTARSQLRATLQFLGLIDENYVPQDSLSELVQASGDERKPLIDKILRERYSFLFDSRNGFDLTRSTSKEFGDRFAAFKLTGDSRGRAESFFLNAAKYAEIPISKYILNNRTGWSRRERKKDVPSGEANGTKQDRKQDELKDERLGGEAGRDEGNQQPSQLENKLLNGQYGLLHKLQIERLPANGQWTSEDKEDYMASYTALLKMLVKVVEASPDQGVNIV